MRTEGNEGIAPLRFLGLLLFQKSALGDVKIGRAPIRKSLSGELRQRSRFRALLRVGKVKSYGLTPTPVSLSQRLSPGRNANC